MKSHSFTKLHWKLAKENLKKPFLFINRAFGRYSITQDDKNKTKDKK